MLPESPLPNEGIDVTAPPPAETVSERLRSLIVSGELPLGSRIYDKQLAEDMGVSRTPVREALLQLQNEGLVVIRPQSGTFVFTLEKADLHHICVTRTILEAGAIRFGLAEGSAETFATLGALVGRAAVALEDGDLNLCDELDWKFHEALIASTGNPFLVKGYSGISAQLRALRQHLPGTPERVGRAIEQHRRIIDLCAAGRVDDAVRQLDDHVGNVEHLLVGLQGVFVDQSN